jgi:hypothetical protein
LTIDEALKQLNEFGRVGDDPSPVSQEEVRCPDTQEAVRILATAYDRVRRRDPLYGERRRPAVLPPPPGRVLSG